MRVLYLSFTTSGDASLQAPQQQFHEGGEAVVQGAARELPVREHGGRVKKTEHRVEHERDGALCASHRKKVCTDALFHDPLDQRPDALAMPADGGLIRVVSLGQQVEQVPVGFHPIAPRGGKREQKAFQLVVGRVRRVGDLGQRRLERPQPFRHHRVGERGLRPEIAIDVGVRHPRLLRYGHDCRASESVATDMIRGDGKDALVLGQGRGRILRNRRRQKAIPLFNVLHANPAPGCRPAEGCNIKTGEHKARDAAARNRRRPRHKSTILRLLGPGVVAGAADDDPSGIATYSQAGAQFGYGMLWTVVLAYPFMVAIQMVSARIGRGTGHGIVSNVRALFPRWMVLWLVVLLLAANTINIAADLAAMGAALKLMLGGPAPGYALMFGLFCAGMEVLLPYRRYAPILKALTMVLFVYVGTVLSVTIDWPAALRFALVPQAALSREAIMMVVAIFGTTISPYVFFWQAGEEVEDMRLRHQRDLKSATSTAGPTLSRIGLDTAFGMGFSNVIAACIMLTTAATLHAQGQVEIATSADAAEALRPLAGDFAFILFACGIIGTGLLAVPVLAGSAAYGVAEAMDWRSGLELAPRRAKGFYSIIGGATIIGALIALSPLDPIRMLFWAAVINGVVAVPVMAVMMLLVSRKEVMGHVAAHGLLKFAGWGATAIMALVVLAMLVSWVFA